jgi:glutamyl-tRNA synthetase
MAEISLKIIKAHALENSIKHNGKAKENAILAGLFSEGLEKKNIKEFIPKIKEVIKEINSLSLEKQKKELEKLDLKTSKREIRTGLPELINAKKGEVIMRFAPFPSGPLHIGNARPLILNDEYVKMYDGKLILVMDDTIGSEAKPIEPKAYNLIEEGIKWLGVKVDKKIIYKSDRIKKYYEYAEELIKKGYMYICACSKEEMKELKVKQIECSCRQFSSEEQLKRWKEMFGSKEGTRTVRLKTSMKDPDPAFRDRIMFRISDRPHAKLGTKYRVYPLLDFASAIDDHVFGITHILRGNDLMMETKVEKFIWNIFGWEHPETIYNGQFTIEGIEISKSKGSKEVRSGEYIGWNDPRTWSLQSLKDRGITPEALREFILGMGIKKTNVTIPIDTLYTLNNKNLDGVPRYFFVENPTKITIKGTPDLIAKIPLNPNRRLGDKIYKTTQEFLIDEQDFGLMQNKNYRLMHLLNFKSDNILRIKPREFSFVSEKPDNNLKTKFIHWLPANGKNINVEIKMPNNKVIRGLGEPKLSDLKVGTIIQFERFGFVRLYKKNKSGMEFWFANN